jgi:hypothetical protein
VDQLNISDGDLAMAYSSGRLFGVVTAAAVAVLVAGCGGSSGGDNPSAVYGSGSVTGSSSAAGAANGTGTKTSEAHGKTGSTGTGSTKTTGHGGTKQPGPGGTKVGGGGGHTGGGGGTPTGTTTHTPTPSNCTESTSAGAHIEVCPGKSLSNGQQMKITGDHFKPNENLLYMECRYKGEDANNYSANDCTVVLTKLGQSSTKSDSNGNLGPVYLNAAEHFKNVDCGQCMVTVAVPIQKSDADNPHALIYFD